MLRYLRRRRSIVSWTGTQGTCFVSTRTVRTSPHPPNPPDAAKLLYINGLPPSSRRPSASYSLVLPRLPVRLQEAWQRREYSVCSWRRSPLTWLPWMSTSPPLPPARLTHLPAHTYLHLSSSVHPHLFPFFLFLLSHFVVSSLEKLDAAGSRL
ncbi:hypothetical protein GQ53DRAFT_75040 [Thozetella sp. PMI_491]|nr:hypothetical protein GQ53DRAFT_75040 [Thozetella sp. PMI_491]